MDNAKIAEQVKELDRLYLASERALIAWIDDPTDENWKRGEGAWDAYNDAKARADAAMAAWEQEREGATR